MIFSRFQIITKTCLKSHWHFQTTCNDELNDEPLKMYKVHMQNMPVESHKIVSCEGTWSYISHQKSKKIIFLHTGSSTLSVWSQCPSLRISLQHHHWQVFLGPSLDSNVQFSQIHVEGQKSKDRIVLKRDKSSISERIQSF